MPSSIKMIKASKVFGGSSSAKIETQIDLSEEKIAEVEPDTQAETEVNKAKKKSRMLLEQAKIEAENLKENATVEIENMRQATYEEALASGQKEGYEAGFNQGLTKGLEQAKVQNEALKASIMVMLKKVQEEIKSYQEDTKEEMVKLASHMAEKIVHDHIDATDEGLLKLITPFLYQLDKDEEFVSITTHPKQQPMLEEQLPKIEAVSPNTRFLVFADPSLEENGLVLESSRAVIDLQVQKQIAAMLQEFEEVERTVND